MEFHLTATECHCGQTDTPHNTYYLLTYLLICVRGGSRTINLVVKPLLPSFPSLCFPFHSLFPYWFNFPPFYSASAQLVMQRAVKAMIDSVRLSVRLSATAWYHIKKDSRRSCGLHRRIAPWL